MYHFVYLTTNLVTGKQYVGDHSSNFLNDSYLGSGIELKNSVRKRGRNSFKREILELFETRKEAFNAQEKYINEYNTLTPNGYNLSPIGGLGLPGALSEISLERMRKNVSKVNKGRTSHRKGKKLSEEHINNIKENCKSPNLGKIFSVETRKKMSDSANHKGSKNPMHSKKQSEKSKELNRISALNRPKITCKYCNKNISKSMHTRWHGEKCKEKI